MWSMLIRITKVAIVLIIATVVGSAIITVKNQVNEKQRKADQQIQQIKSESESKQQQEKEQYEKKIKELEVQLQAKLVEKARLASIEASKTAEKAKVVQVIAQGAQASSGGSNDAKMFIYMKESGNNPYAVNKSSGACGLAQALPCSKMNCALGDYACQDQWATNYMLNRYGTWENAKAFWLSHNWW